MSQWLQRQKISGENHLAILKQNLAFSPVVLVGLRQKTKWLDASSLHF